MPQKRKLLLGEGQAEAEVVVAVVGRVVVAVRRAAVPRVVVPATASVHTVRPTIRLSPNLFGDKQL